VESQSGLTGEEEHVQLGMIGLGRMGGGEADYADKILSALRAAFGGHQENR
jgi:6-phosphogluconate dehydrogenase (decarboxylating)